MEQQQQQQAAWPGCSRKGQVSFGLRIYLPGLEGLVEGLFVFKLIPELRQLPLDLLMCVPEPCGSGRSNEGRLRMLAWQMVAMLRSSYSPLRSMEPTKVQWEGGL